MNPTGVSRTVTFCLVGLLAIQVLVGSASAQRVAFYDFGGPKGANPFGGLIVDGNGNFYGTTFAGGSGIAGVVYEMSPGPNGKAMETVLYNFTGNGSNGDGTAPNGNLVMDPSGNLYGVTRQGGSAGNPGSLCPSIGCGTVFELSPPTVQGGKWTETILYSFQGSPSDGYQPTAGLVMDSAGNLYGTTSLGGVNSAFCDGGCGTVFELSPPTITGGVWTETVLYFFQGVPDGDSPFGALIFDAVGHLYGTTSLGGVAPNEGGTVFELSPPAEQGGEWSENVLYSFAGFDDGGLPMTSLALGSNGALYGTTSCCGSMHEGTVFRILPPPQPGGSWTFEVIYNSPMAGLTPVTLANAHTLYGMYGGSSGTTLYRITYFQGVQTVTEFPFGPGLFPLAGLTLYNGAIYGTTSGGGFNRGGTAFRIAP